jgi:hypothetical protein
MDHPPVDRVGDLIARNRELLATAVQVHARARVAIAHAEQTVMLVMECAVERERVRGQPVVAMPNLRTTS